MTRTSQNLIVSYLQVGTENFSNFGPLFPGNQTEVNPNLNCFLKKTLFSLR